ncbi:phosphotransferase enzyme family protein [Paenibacillus jiagnxiensis]|uniref:phosphotransferase enzyme family protein n=1 Tax=Paenibacillus jiagnxiensis TaxID=3228926 RepID=UPI0033BD4ED2
MNNFMRIDTEEEIRKLLMQGRKTALTALQEYDLAWTQIRFIQLSDTITFKIDTETDGCYLVRVHTNGMTIEEIQSEIIWLNALGKCDGITVPKPLASRDGTYVLEIVMEQDFCLCVTMMHWLEGEQPGSKLTDRQVMNAGAMMARLHEASASFVPEHDFKRPAWGADSFKNDMAKLELYYERFLSEKAWKSYQTAADKISNQLVAMKSNGHNYGLIHADLHMGNLVFKDDEPFPIDFGRCGYGYHLYDIAGAIIGLPPHKRKIFLQGYESVRELEPDYSESLSCFFVMFMIENYCTHAPDPRETSGLIKEQPYAQAIIRDFLNGAPFLFNSIEPMEIE